MTSRADYAHAVDELAARVLDGLRGGQDAGLLADYVDHAANVAAALAAVRVLGADALVVHLLMKMPLTARENEVLAESLRVFPAAGTNHPHLEVVSAWRDWTLAQVASRCRGALPTIACPLGAVSADPDDWRSWSTAIAQLSTLAVPGLDSPIHDLARRHPLALARGATCAVLRRDHPIAAALGRWLALLHTDGIRLALDPALLAEHVGLLGGGDNRTALDARIAGDMLRRAAG
jgi:hypothetical protein